MYKVIFSILIIAASNMSSAWAYRVIEQIESSYELILGEVSLPRAESGSVTFTPCADCKATSLRVSSRTTYLVNGAAYEFEEFLSAAEAIEEIAGGSQNTAVYLYFDSASGHINRLALDHILR